MKIGDFEIGSRPFTIAEVGLNHNGSEMAAIEMIAQAKQAGVTAVKFQTFKADEFCRPDDPLYPHFKRSEFDASVWPRLQQACDDAGIMFMSTPQNVSDLELLLPLGIQAIKIGSDDCVNLPLVLEYAKHGLPLIISAGMAWPKDLASTVVELARLRAPAAYLVCTSQYPTPPEEVRISRVPTLQDFVSPAPVGFSDHTMGPMAAVMAVALGAAIFEKHFTLDHNLDGPDHKWACDPQQLAEWVWSINHAWEIRGTSDSLMLTEAEEAQRQKYQRRAGAKLRGAP